MRQSLSSMLFAILTGMTLTILSCRKDELYMSNAEIIGLDVRTCLCCGGVEISIDNVSNPNGNTYFLIGQLPTNFNLGTIRNFQLQ